MDKAIYVAMTGAKEVLRAQTANNHNLANVTTTGFRADLTSRDRGVHPTAVALFGKPPGKLPGFPHARGSEINHHRAGHQSLRKATLAEHHRIDHLGPGQIDRDDPGSDRRTQVGESRDPCHSERLGRRGRSVAAVPDKHFCPRPMKMPRHGRPHVAEADESDRALHHLACLAS